MGSILLVDDDLDIRESFADFLREEGYQVFEAEDGAQALKRMEATGEDPCLVLLDLMMPVMNGREFLEHLRVQQKLESVPVVVLTAAGPGAPVVGARRVLRKPIALGALLDAVREFCPNPGAHA